jgi:phage tail-like protein
MIAALPAEDVARHWLLDRRAGWRAALLDSLEESPCDDGLRLAALPASGRPLVDPAGTLGGLVAPTGVAVDGQGHVYLVDGGEGGGAAPRIKRYDPCCAGFETLPCLGGEGSAPRRLRDPHGIALAAGKLYVADTGNRRVQVFSLHGLLLLAIWGPLDAAGRRVAAGAPGAWQPWGIAISQGRVSITDHDNGLVHRFRGGRWRWARDGAAPGGPALVHPTHIAADRQGRLYVAQEGADHVVVLDADGRYLGRAEPPERLRGNFRPGPLATDEAGDLYLFDAVSRDLSRYCCSAQPGTPVRLVAGACHVGAPVAGLAFTPGGDPLLTVPSGGQVIHLEGARSFATRGRLLSEPLDSHLEGCQWHRVVLRGSVPPGGSVTVHTFCSELERDPDQVAELPESAWAGGLTWSAEAEWDCLVLSAPGRYLWLRLTVAGPGTDGPVVSSVEVHFPRLSSIQHLPAVYRSTPQADFLDRLLAVFDQVGETVGDTLDRLPGCLEPAATPASPAPPSRSLPQEAPGPDFLSWLAGWVGLVFQGTWSVTTRRRLLRNAVRIYGLRGTRAGLRQALDLLLDIEGDACCDLPVPGVLEGFTLRRWAFLGASTLGDRALWGKRVVDRLQLGEHSTIGQFRITDVGDPLRDPFHVYAHRFTVFLPAACVGDEVTGRAVEQMIELTKPAHTQHQLELVRPSFRIGVQATVGLDTAIGRYPDAAVTGRTRVGRGVVGQPRPTAGIALDRAVLGRAVL